VKRAQQDSRAAPARVRRAAVEPERGTLPERLALVVLWALVLLPPLVVFPTAKESFRTPKLLVSEWLALASLVPLAWGLKRVEGSWRELWSSFWRHAAVRACLPLALVASAGAFTTAHPVQFREAFADLWIGAAALIGWSLALSSARLERLLAGLLWPAAGLALFGILQAHGVWRPLGFSGPTVFDPRLAITATAGNPGDLGAYLVLPCLVAQWLLVRAGRERQPAGRRLLQGLALALCAYCLAVTQTLAAVAAAGLGSLVFWAVVMPRRRFLALAGGSLACALLLIVLVPPLRVRAAAKLGQARQGNLNAVLTGRLDGWRTAVWMLREHPLWGVGQGAFRAEFVPAKLALLDRGVAFYSGPQLGTFGNAHNEVLEVGADLGVPGLLALAWGLWVLFGALRRGGSRRAELDGRGSSRAELPEDRGGGTAAEAALAWAIAVALGTLALVLFPFRIALLAFPALLALAWMLRRGDEAQRALEGTVKSGPVAAPATVARVANLARLAIVVILLAALGGQSLRLLERREGSRLLHQAELISVAIEGGQVPIAMVFRNLEALRRAAELDPVEVGVPIARGTQYLLLPHPDTSAALAAFAAADRLEPRPATRILRGRALLAAGSVADAEREFALGLRLDPTLAPAVPRH
jgi:O-antigen ligase